jgi:outer membrane protein OmpA-like peptidoglycan-associated protein
MIEFAVVGPIITMLGLSILQYGMMFFAKNQINHASFMAARAGSMGNANLTTVRNAYARALIPMYGGGKTDTELAEAYAKAVADTSAYTQIKLLNPTKESFDDWGNDPALKQKYGARAIPNSGQMYKDANVIGSASKQNIQDANLIKLRITHGYEPKVPLVAKLYQTYLKAEDPGTDAFYTQLVNAGRIPVVTDVTLKMKSDPVEGDNVSNPDNPNTGTPTDPGTAPSTPTDTPPPCQGCTTQNAPGTGSSGSDPLMCTGTTTVYTLPGDVFFDFGKATLTAAGKSQLDTIIAQAKANPSSVNSVTLTGYTDQLANPGFDNTQLSLDRAAAVRDYLQANGFPNKPMTVQGLDSQNPVKQLSDCPYSGQALVDCLAPNRRVEVRVN